MLAYTVIRNAVTGISITSDNSSVPELMIINSKIMHNSVGSLIAVNANVYSANSLFSHSGFNTISVSGNGSYDFIHCTIANRWEYGFRTAPVFFISKDNGILPDVTITNSVITGNLENELMINATPGEIAGKILADSSLIKVDTLTAPWWNRNIFKSVITKGEAGFIEESKYDYRPDTLSLLLNMAGRSEAVNWPFDIRNKMRPTGEGPDIGAYERQTGEKKNKE